MESSTLAQILDLAEGVTSAKGAFEAVDGHQLSFYLGEPGSAMILAEVQKVSLHPAFVQLDRKEGSVYLDYAAVHGLAVRAPKDKSGRAGF